MEKLDLASPDLVNENFEKLAALFPNCVTESANGKAIDFDLLKQELSHAVVEGNKERYRLEWPGKREAIVTSNLPTTKTLRPVREDSVDFDNTENIYIEGDNLEVLKLLQESYLGKIKMIYIDPPYNTGKDFVYKDNFTQDSAEFKEESGQTDEYNRRLVVNPETAGRYHSDWLTMMYPRLKLARNLLTDDGVIFISVNNIELHNTRKICDEIFSEKNFIECISWNKRVPKNDKGIGNIHEFILVYVKNNELDHLFKMPKDGLDDIFELVAALKKKNVPIPEAEDELKKFYKKKGYDRGITLYNCLDRNYELWGKINMSWPNANTFGPRYEVIHPSTGKPVKIPERGWRWKEETFKAEVDYVNIVELPDGSFMCGNIWFAKDENTQPSSINYLSKVDTMLLRSIISLKSDGGIETENLFANKSVFSYPKPTSLLKTLIESIDLTDAIVLDFFSGSATAADAALQANLLFRKKIKFIMVQLPENLDESLKVADANSKQILLNAISILDGLDKPHLLTELGKERIRRAAYKLKSELRDQISTLQSKIEKKKKEWADEKNKLLKDPNFFELIKAEISELQSSVLSLQQKLEDLDFGFRVFRLSDSNMQDVYHKPQDYKQEALDLFADNIKPDRTPDDLLIQIMLAWGLPLSLKIEQTSMTGKSVFKVAENSLFACFEMGIDEEFAKEIAKSKPLRIVFRDKGFKDDTAKANVRQLLKQLSPETEVRVI